MVNDTVLCVRGWAGADPVRYDNEVLNEATGEVRKNVTAVTRMGVTPRVRDWKTGEYADGETTWYTVRCYGRLAENVMVSVKRGTPLLVRGRLVSRRYQDRDGNDRTDLVIMADSCGIDMSLGSASYERRASGELSPLAGEPGRPVTATEELEVSDSPEGVLAHV